MKKVYIIWFLIFFFPFINKTLAYVDGDEEPIEPVLELFYFKDTEEKIHLKTSLVHYIDRQPVALPGFPILYSAGEDSVRNLGISETDKEGKADFLLDEFPADLAGEDGTVRFYAEFPGNDSIMATEWEIYIQDVSLELILELIDSVKTVSAKAYLRSGDEQIPVPDEDIYFYVPRMFSDLSVGEEFLDENGEISIEFPDDLPGNAEGYLEIVVRFDDHYMFGTVEKRERIKWGIPTMHVIPESYRALWTQIAPWWMIITLSILLAGVWSHYIYSVIQLIKIKRLGRKQNE